MALKEYQKDFIMHLVKSGALKFGQFKLKSGRISPYFVNIATAINDGKLATKTVEAYVDAIMDKVKLEFDFLHGPAYKGIPLASMVAIRLWEKYEINVRWGYDRKEVKEYGDLGEKSVIGDLRDGDKVLIIDDVITTGSTKLDNWRKLSRTKNVHSAGIMTAVDRQELSKEERNRLEYYGLKIYNIVNITEVFEFFFEREVEGKVHVDEEIKKQFDSYFEKYGVGF